MFTSGSKEYETSGVVFDGPMAGALVEVYSFNAGQKGAFLGAGQTDDKGVFSIPIQASSQPVVIEIFGSGQYIDEPSGASINLRADEGLKTLLHFGSGRAHRVNLTPFTLLAAGLAEFRLSQGDGVTTAIDNADTTISTLVGTDVVTTNPLNIRVQAQLEGVDDETLYGFSIAALSSYTKWLSDKIGGENHESYPSIALAQLMYDDIRSDGVLDGLGQADASGVPTQLNFANASLNADVYRSALAQHMLVMANSAVNQTGLNAQNLISEAKSIASSDAPIFPGAANAPSLDLEGPVITTSEPPGVFYKSGIEYKVQVSDQSPVQSISFNLDGEALGEAADLTNPSIVFDTARFADGEHSLGITALDEVGNLGSATFSVNFDNTAPVISVTSPTLTNQQDFTIAGAYQPSGAPLASLSVNSNVVAVSPELTWEAPVFLNSGANPIEIVAIDQAQNEYRASPIISLDKVEPEFSFRSFSEEALFWLQGSQCIIRSLLTANSGGLPLYFDANNLNVGLQQPYSWFELIALGVPFIRFYVNDPVVAGVGTDASNIQVSMSYSINDVPIVTNRQLDVHRDPRAIQPYYLIPLAGETLPSEWSQSSPGDVHAIVVTLEDEAGNQLIHSLSTFKAVFGQDACQVVVQ